MLVEELLVGVHIVFQRVEKVQLPFSHLLFQVAKDNVLLESGWLQRIDVGRAHLRVRVLENELALESCLLL